MELAVAAALRFLVPEHRPQGIDPVGAVVEQIVFDHRAHHAGGELGTHGQAFAVERVGEGVHFLLDDVGDFADAAREQAGVLQHGRAHIAVAIGGQPVADDGFELLPAGALAWQYVFHAREGLDFLERLRHKNRGL